MEIQEATRRYEAWLAAHLPLVREDLATKHEAMRASPFAFLRATFYRWVQRFPAVCPGSAAAPHLLAVGDLHLENFGTWRDEEGRLVWGLNDFDECHAQPYTNDLVRLATSAGLASKPKDRETDLRLETELPEACKALLVGYTRQLERGPTLARPFVLAETNDWLRELALSSLDKRRDPTAYWKDLRDESAPAAPADVPAAARALLEAALPEPGLPYELRRRPAGLGSLGRPRWTALAEWRGAAVARDVKALAPSGCTWLARPVGAPPGAWSAAYADALRRAVRVPDPFVRAQDGWVVRRLAADCSRIRLELLAKQQDADRLLRAMGRETANVHLGTPDAVEAILRDLAQRPRDWLLEAASAMLDATHRDWKAWKEAPPPVP